MVRSPLSETSRVSTLTLAPGMFRASSLGGMLVVVVFLFCFIAPWLGYLRRFGIFEICM